MSLEQSCGDQTSPGQPQVSGSSQHAPVSPTSGASPAAAAKRRSDEKEAAARMKARMKAERAAKQRELSLEASKSPASPAASEVDLSPTTGSVTKSNPGDTRANDHSKAKTKEAQEATAQEAEMAEQEAARKSPFKVVIVDLNNQKMV